MFEEKTYENILTATLAKAPPGVDIRQGSIFYDAVAGVCFKIASFYTDLSTAFDLVFLTTAVDEYLDQKGAEYGIYRNPATSARYKYSFEGSQPSKGERFFTEGQYFELRSVQNELLLEAEETGTGTNTIPPGSPAIPVNRLYGLTSSTFGELIEPGVDVEEDEDYRQRIREKVAGPAENGNRQHYKTWCEEVAGVGRARIIPLWDGESTVKGVIVGSDGAPAAETVVDRVQDYVDPGGTGLGNGVANIGAHFTAVPAEDLPITVSFTATLAKDATEEQAMREATDSITAHLKELALNTPDSEAIIVRISTIGALLYALPSIIDYADLTFNGEAANIEVLGTQVATLKEVLLNAALR